MKFLNKRFFLIVVMIMTSMSLSAQKKNVLVFVVDDLGYYDIELHGSKLYETPAIDALAKEGVDFSNAYVAHPRCVPSRYALQTGQYPARVKVPGTKEKLKEGDSTIGQAFQKAGYQTFFAGKWHLGHHEEEFPHHKGYDINIAGCSAGAPRSYFAPYNVSKNKKSSGKHGKIIGLDDAPKGEYITDRLTDETVKFINQKHDKPFFAMLAHYGVHTPIQGKKDMVDKYKKKLEGIPFEGERYIKKDGTTKMRQDNVTYAAMIESVDESMSRVIKALKDKGLYKNTIIVFTSDHGGLSNRGVNNKRELATSNLPLRAGKGHVYEGGVKVPFIMVGPGVAKNKVNNQVTVNTDIFPTLLDMCGLDLLPEQHKDGMSIKPYLKKKRTDRTLFWHSPKDRPTSTGDTKCTAIRVGDYKLLDFYEEGKLELYDLKNDPTESNNLADSKKKLTKDLKTQIDQWRKEVEAFGFPKQ